MRAIAFALVAVVAMAAISGCNGKSKKDPTVIDPELEFSESTGILQGVVVTEAVAPIPNADVMIIGPAGNSTSAKTDAEGKFGFDKLAPGAYAITASKLGYFSEQITTSVRAGDLEPPVVKLTLRIDEANRPYAFTYTFNGFLTCGFGVTQPGVGYAAGPCAVDETLDPAFPDDQSTANYTLDRPPMWVQSELVWESGQPASTWMNFNFAYPDGTHQDGWNDLGFLGGPPLLVGTMDEETALEYTYTGWGLNGTQKPNLYFRVFAWANDDMGPIAAFQQKFQVLTTVFYGYAPPEGWLFYDGDGVPSPP